MKKVIHAIVGAILHGAWICLLWVVFAVITGLWAALVPSQEAGCKTAFTIGTLAALVLWVLVSIYTATE